MRWIAACTSTSARPKRSSMAAAIRWTAASSDTSMPKATAVPPAASTSAATASQVRWSTSIAAIAAPSAAKRSALARPMPPPAPLMTTTRGTCPGSAGPGPGRPRHHRRLLSRHRTFASAALTVAAEIVSSSWRDPEGDAFTTFHGPDTLWYLSKSIGPLAPS